MSFSQESKEGESTRSMRQGRKRGQLSRIRCGGENVSFNCTLHYKSSASVLGRNSNLDLCQARTVTNAPTNALGPSQIQGGWCTLSETHSPTYDYLTNYFFCKINQSRYIEHKNRTCSSDIGPYGNMKSNVH